jgi:hypothetical protein
VTTWTSGRACSTIGAAGAPGAAAAGVAGGVAPVGGRVGRGTIVRGAGGETGATGATGVPVLAGVDSARTWAMPIVATSPNIVDAPTPRATIRAPAAG